MNRLTLWLGCAGCLATPLIAVRIAPYVAATRPLGNTTSWTWLHPGLIGVALGLLIVPLVLRRPLRQSRNVLKERGIDVEQVLLFFAVSSASTASLMPVIAIALGADASRLVSPWAVACFLCEAIWCWRFRHVL